MDARQAISGMTEYVDARQKPSGMTECVDARQVISGMTNKSSFSKPTERICNTMFTFWQAIKMELFILV